MGRDRHWLELMRRRVALVWELATDRRMPWRARAPAMLALAYVASPIDLIPDSLPGIGWLDDVMVLMIAAAVTPLLVPRSLVARHLAQSRRSPADAALLREADGLVALPWLLIAIGTLLACAAVLTAMADLGTSG
jgi:uncharacterized membrane protein YkvA (DUF1232 family)